MAGMCRTDLAIGHHDCRADSIWNVKEKLEDAVLLRPFDGHPSLDEFNGRLDVVERLRHERTNRHRKSCTGIALPNPDARKILVRPGPHFAEHDVIARAMDFSQWL